MPFLYTYIHVEGNVHWSGRQNEILQAFCDISSYGLRHIDPAFRYLRHQFLPLLGKSFAPIVSTLYLAIWSLWWLVAVRMPIDIKFLQSSP